MTADGILNLVSTLAVLAGVIFGIIQLRQFEKSRRREGAVLILNSLQTEEFLRGLRVLGEIPPGLDKAGVEARAGEDLDALYLVVATWERIGILVYRRELSLEMVEDAHSGTIVNSWIKLQGFVEGLRELENRDTVLEWFQWLAERIIEREDQEPPVPAYLDHQDWQP